LPLAEACRRLFTATPAHTPELRREAFRLRYQVYCVEHSFLNPAENPGGLERDAYDDHAVQGILAHRETGATVGTVRLVLHRPGTPHGCLPVHDVCDPRFHDLDLLPLETTCELSRFAFSKTFMRHLGGGSGASESDRDDLSRASQRTLPHITLGLISLALQMGMAHGVHTVCAIIDPALLRLVGRLGIHFEPLGPPVGYHGLRQPCYARVSTLISRVKAEQPSIWELITDGGRVLPSDDGDAHEPDSIGRTLRQSSRAEMADAEDLVRVTVS
jgi:N-acyl amino acid synthase of PEP-CTERM/exosortase system